LDSISSHIYQFDNILTILLFPCIFLC